jgi:hypothetical protein
MFIYKHNKVSLSYHNHRPKILTVLTHVLGPDSVGFPRKINREG